ncbi:MAG TPA: hypothetical protein VIY49_16605 [Bryobacteraceae bacterium]
MRKLNGRAGDADQAVIGKNSEKAELLRVDAAHRHRSAQSFTLVASQLLKKYVSSEARGIFPHPALPNVGENFCLADPRAVQRLETLSDVGPDYPIQNQQIPEQLLKLLSGEKPEHIRKRSNCLGYLGRRWLVHRYRFHVGDARVNQNLGQCRLPEGLACDDDFPFEEVLFPHPP